MSTYNINRHLALTSRWSPHSRYSPTARSVLVACEESQAVTKALRAVGVEAYSADFLPCSGGRPEWHIQGDVRPLLRLRWGGVIAFPTCQFLTVSANRWFADQPQPKSGVLVGAARRAAREEAIKFALECYNANSDFVAVENPIGCLSSRFRKPDQVIQPWQYGHGETKATCLWLRGLPCLTATDIVDGRDGKIHKMAPSKDRAKLRSKTFPGIAEAMGSQWHHLLK